jgi:hypothetical protein
MPSITRRIANLERAVGALSDDGPCRCQFPGPGTAITVDREVLKFGPCARCGKTRPVIYVIYDTPAGEKAKHVMEKANEGRDLKALEHQLWRTS